jgi:hypothetical protein
VGISCRGVGLRGERRDQPDMQGSGDEQRGQMSGRPWRCRWGACDRYPLPSSSSHPFARSTSRRSAAERRRSSCRFLHPERHVDARRGDHVAVHGESLILDHIDSPNNLRISPTPRQWVVARRPADESSASVEMKVRSVTRRSLSATQAMSRSLGVGSVC